MHFEETQYSDRYLLYLFLFASTIGLNIGITIIELFEVANVKQDFKVSGFQDFYSCCWLIPIDFARFW